MTIPHWLLATIGAVLSVGPIATMCLWGFVWLRIEQSARTVPTLRRGQRLAAADPPTGQVCVVVPAHDEAATIAALIRSLRAETYPEFSVVLALDRCTDATAAVARAAIAGDARFAIVELDSCPEAWAGKVHAVHAGVTRSPAAAAADYLLFADADTTFEPGCIAAALALMRERRLDLLSLLSTLTHDAWYERVVQTAAALELMRQYPLTRRERPQRSPRVRQRAVHAVPSRRLRRGRRARGGEGCAARGSRARPEDRRGRTHARRVLRRGAVPLPDVRVVAGIPPRLEAHLHRGRRPTGEAAVAAGVARSLARHDPAGVDARGAAGRRAASSPSIRRGAGRCWHWRWRRLPYGRARWRGSPRWRRRRCGRDRCTSSARG